MAKAEKEQESRYKDPEIAALGKIDKILSPLPFAAKLRILNWLRDKHCTIKMPEDRPGIGPNADHSQ
jgi:hypothetical protein